MKNALANEETSVRFFHQALAYEQAGQKNLAAVTMQKALNDGLSRKMLDAPGSAGLSALEKAALAISPPKKK